MFILPGLSALPIGAMVAIAGASPTISLDFKAALDSRITFTRAGTAAYTDASGTIVYAATGVPRIDYDPISHAAIGTLLEAASTNIVTFSDDLNNAAWLKTNVTIGSNTSVAPDGATTADKIAETTTNAAHTASTASLSFTSGTSYAVTFWAKANERNLLQWVFGSSPFGANAWCTFDLSNGTIQASGPAVVDASIVAHVGGYYFCRLVAACTSTVASRCLFALANNTTNGALRSPAYAGTTGSGATVWGAQIEVVPRTSYIPTTSTALSRVADLAIMTGTNFSSWWSAASGSLVVKARPPILGVCPIWEASDNTINNVIRIYSQDGTINVLVMTGGVEQAFLTLGTITAGTEAAITLAYANNNFTASLNGGAPVSDLSGTVPTLTQCRFGSDSFSNGLNGQIVEFKAYA